MKCEKCGNEVEQGNMFCTDCGARLLDEDATKIYIRGDEDTEESLEQK